VNVKRPNTILSTTVVTVAELCASRKVQGRVSSATYWLVCSLITAAKVTLVCMSVCLSVCLSVSRIIAEVICHFHWNLMLWLDYQWEELINFRWWSRPGYSFQITFPLPSPLQNRVPDTASRSLFHFPHHCRIGLLQHFSYSHRPLFMKLGKVSDADKGMNPLHSGNDPADTRIRISHDSWNPDLYPGSLLLEVSKVQEVSWH